MKKASGKLENKYCMSCAREKGDKTFRTALTITGYDDTGKRGGIRISGVCPKGHKVSTFMGKDDFEAATKAGKIIKGGGKCPYAGGEDEKVEDAAASSSAAAAPMTGSEIDVFEGSAKRRSRGSRGSHKAGARKSRSKSHSKKSHSKKSKSHSHKSKSKSKSHSRHGKKK